MTRPTTITLSFLLVLLVIVGMTIKSQMENVARPVADSLVKHPEITTDRDKMKVYEVYVDSAYMVTRPIGKDTLFIVHPIFDTASWIVEHSKIPTR